MTASNPAVPVDGILRPGRLDRLALAALGHPVSVCAVALLLLNDHVLKRAVPSALTGKLSDFAGLFFFPFLLAALAGLAARPANRCASQAPVAFAFFATAVVFALVKVDPAAHALAVRTLGVVIGAPVSIVRDPTDLIALIALLPAWALWRSSTVRGPGPSSPRALLGLGLASLASLATAPCIPVLPVERLVVYEGSAYALIFPESPEGSVFRSESGTGWTGLATADVPKQVLALASAPVDLPKTVCVPQQERTCYRAAGEESLQATSDGGATWQTVWRSPAARRSYMQRVADRHGQPIACGKEIDLRAMDVAVLGVGPDHLAVVALGNEGVLVGRADGDWSHAGIGSAQPTPDRGGMQDLMSPWLVFEETLVALLAAAAAALYFSSVAWRRYRVPESQGGPKRSDLPWKTGVVVTLLIAVLMFALNVETLIPYAFVPVVGFAAWTVILWTGWLQTLEGTRAPRATWTALGLSILGSLAVGLALWLPFALWTLGTIAAYPAALLVALGGATGIIILFRRVISGRGPSGMEPVTGASP